MKRSLTAVILTAIANACMSVAEHFDEGPEDQALHNEEVTKIDTRLYQTPSLHIVNDMQDGPVLDVPTIPLKALASASALGVDAPIVKEMQDATEEMHNNDNPVGNTDPNPALSPESVFNDPTSETVADSAPAAVPPPPPPPAGVELDSEGIPWDARINPDSRLKLARTGGWKLKRGIDKAFVEKVKQELRGLMTVAAPSNPVAPTTPVPNPAPVTPPPPAPPAPATPPPPLAATGSITTIPELMRACIDSKKTPETLKEACISCGVEDTPLLASRPDLIPAVAKALGL